MAGGPRRGGRRQKFAISQQTELHTSTIKILTY